MMVLNKIRQKILQLGIDICMDKNITFALKVNKNNSYIEILSKYDESLHPFKNITYINEILERLDNKKKLSKMCIENLEDIHKLWIEKK